jgi:excinuclease ABC subunit C
MLSDSVSNPDLISAMLREKSDHTVSVLVPKIGEKAKLMGLCKRNAELLLTELIIQKEQRTKIIPNSLIELQAELRLPQIPHRIECFDISTLQGSETVASMVVFIDGKPKKSEYRKYKIESTEGIDDFASMREAVLRRYSRLINDRENFPDLIIVDGGKGQLSSALSILDSINNKFIKEGQILVPVIGLAKRLEEIYTPGKSEPFTIPKTSPSLRMIQRIRDEAHRFAITYHRILRKKKTLTTELDLIKGIGKKRAKELLELFGSVQGVKFATIEQLSAIVGESVAASIKEYFLSSDDEKNKATND